MASEGPNSPGTMANDATIGTIAWTGPDYAKLSDDYYASVGSYPVTNIWDSSVRLVIGGSIVGSNKATSTDLTSSDTYYPFGGSSDLWGNAITYSNVNASDFGVVISYSINDGGPSISNYLKATNFGFSIPVGATIDGVLAEVEAKQQGEICYVDHIRITVYYTEGVAEAVSSRLLRGHGI